MGKYFCLSLISDKCLFSKTKCCVVSDLQALLADDRVWKIMVLHYHVGNLKTSLPFSVKKF